ncbi:hypothetical protein ACYOEI_05890 [Singulisphaera rosea]
MSYTEAARLRIDDQSQVDQATRSDQPAPEDSPFVVCVTSHKTTYPTTAQVFYWVVPQAVLGTETEGGAASFSNDGGGFFAANLGDSVPPEGTKVECQRVPHRWIFRYTDS